MLFCLIADASLTVDNVTKVMEITSADGTTNVWKKVALLVEVIKWKSFNSQGEDMSVCGDLPHFHSNPSWRYITSNTSPRCCTQQTR